MSPASRHRLTFFLPSACCRVAMHFSCKVAGVPASARCRAAALPGERGRTRAAGPAGSRTGWGRRPVRRSPPLLHASCRRRAARGVPGAGRPRCCRLGPTASPTTWRNFLPVGANAPSPACDGRRRCWESRQVVWEGDCQPSAAGADSFQGGGDDSPAAMGSARLAGAASC